MLGWLCPTLFVVGALIAIAVFAWLERRQDLREVEENRQFAESIKHLPVERQAELWATKLRHDAERDLH
jgi:hypothetical protein